MQWIPYQRSIVPGCRKQSRCHSNTFYSLNNHDIAISHYLQHDKEVWYVVVAREEQIRSSPSSLSIQNWNCIKKEHSGILSIWNLDPWRAVGSFLSARSICNLFFCFLVREFLQSCLQAMTFALSWYYSRSQDLYRPCESQLSMPICCLTSIFRHSSVGRSSHGDVGIAVISHRQGQSGRTPIWYSPRKSCSLASLGWVSFSWSWYICSNWFCSWATGTVPLCELTFQSEIHQSSF